MAAKNWLDSFIGRKLTALGQAIRARTFFDFGDGFTVTDDLANDRTIVSVTGASGTSSIGAPVADLAALRALSTTGGGVVDGQVRQIKGTPDSYAYSASTGGGFADDGNTVIQPDDVLLGSNGRWYLVGGAPVVPTIAALRLAVSGKHKTIHVQAYAQLGDGGGGTFDYDSNDTSTSDDGGTIIVAGTRRHKRRYAGKVDLTWFGGKRDVELLASIVTHSNNTIQITGHTYTAAYNGKLIAIEGAGAAGGTLQTTITGGTPATTTFTIASPALISATKAGAIGTNNDDAFDLMLACEAAGGNGGHGHIPLGGFGFLTTIRLPTDYKLQGDGDGSTLYQFGAGVGVQCLDSGNRIEHIRVISLNTNSTKGIRLASVYDASLLHNTVHGRVPDNSAYAKGYSVGGFSLESNAPDATNPGLNSALLWLAGNIAHGCAGAGCYVATDVLGGSSTLAYIGPRNRFQGNDGHGVSCPSNGLSLVTIDNNDLEGNVAGGINIEQCARAIIRNNHFEIAARNCIQIGKTGYICANITIGGNFFGMLTNDPSYAIEFVGGTGVLGVDIEPNYFVCTGSHGKSAIRNASAGVKLKIAQQYEVSGFTPDTGTVPSATELLEDYQGTVSGTIQYPDYEVTLVGPTHGTNNAYGTILDQVNDAIAMAGGNPWTNQQWSPLTAWRASAFDGTNAKRVEAAVGLRGVQATSDPWGYIPFLFSVDQQGDPSQLVSALEVWSKGDSWSNVSFGSTGGDPSKFGGAEGVTLLRLANAAPLTASPYYPSDPAFFTEPNTALPSYKAPTVVTDTGFKKSFAARHPTTPAQGGAEEHELVSNIIKIENDGAAEHELFAIDLGAYPRSSGDLEIEIFIQKTATTHGRAKYHRNIPFKVSTAGVVSIATPELVGTDIDDLTLGAAPTYNTSGSDGIITIKVTGKAGIDVLACLFGNIRILGPVS